MSTYRENLPHLGDELFLTDSGLETDLLFNHGFDLPEFAAFPLLDDEAGRTALMTYLDDHVAVALDAGAGIVLETPTWRASSGWGDRLGYDAAALDRINRTAVSMIEDVRAERASTIPVVISGVIGPEGDGYRPSRMLTPEEAATYHAPQITSYAGTAADMVHAMTMTYVAEAVGIVRAARNAGMPVAISFTVETDSALPDGTPLADAIRATDDATDAGPVYYGINCAHPTHFEGVLDPAADWTARVRSLRANASTMSHAELDEAEELDAGDPVALAASYAGLRKRLPGLAVVGGCCGTDVRHVRAIAAGCL